MNIYLTNMMICILLCLFLKKDVITSTTLDFKKAFDTVPHERLLLKAESYGIQGNILQWLRAFLIGRKQRVSVNGQFGSVRRHGHRILKEMLFFYYFSNFPLFLFVKLPDFRSRSLGPAISFCSFWFFLFYVLVFKIFLCCWRLMYVCIFLVKLR